MIEAKATISTKAINRREFLYYLLGASAAALAAGTCGVASWFTIPYRTVGPRFGLFAFAPSQLPSPTDTPHLYLNEPIGPYASTNFWLSNTEQDLLALQQACTADGCLFKWSQNETAVHDFAHFVCPCCGSQFTKIGAYVDGPARRNLDQFTIDVIMPNGNRHTQADGGPVDIRGATQIVVDIQKKILGKPRPLPTATPIR